MTGSIFLLPNGTFFVELLVVAIILFLVTKYILPPLNKAMTDRQEKIRGSLEAADQARADAAAAEDERQKVVKAEAAGRGQAEYDRIVANAQSEVDAIRQRAIDEASARIGEIVFDLVAKVVGREVDQTAHQDLVREAIAALNAESQREAKP